MGYNLWLSEDSHYSLAYRMGLREAEPCEEPAPHPWMGEPQRASEADLEHIEFLMETLARRVETPPR